MFELFLSFVAQCVEFGLLGFGLRELFVKTLACLFDLVARPLVFALLLVELHLSLLDLALRLLHFRYALLCLTLGFGLYLDLFLACFEQAVFFYHFGFLSGFVDYRAGAACGQIALHYHGRYGTNGNCQNSRDQNDYYIRHFYMSVSFIGYY